MAGNRVERARVLIGPTSTDELVVFAAERLARDWNAKVVLPARTALKVKEVGPEVVLVDTEELLLETLKPPELFALPFRSRPITIME